jgi:hypothetical protein
MSETETTAPAVTTDPTVYVDPFPGKKGSDRIVRQCSGCHGTGIYQGPTPYGPEHFDCHGTGEYSFLVSSARATAHRHVREAIKRATAAAEAPARLAAWREANTDTAAALDALAAIDDDFTTEFAASLTAQIERKGELTAKQEAAIAVAVAKHTEREEKKAAEAAAASPVVEGRIVVTGEVVGTKTVPGYGYHAVDVFKIIVRDDRGFKVYGTCPRSLQVTVGEDGFNDYHTVERGQRVSFTAKVERSDDDETFGFFQRPTKASRV